MIEVYGALMLHGAGQQITEETLKKVIQSAGASVDEGKIKALVSSLEGQDIEKLIQQVSIAAPAAKTEEKKEEKKEDESKKAEEASAGLASLFGA